MDKIKKYKLIIVVTVLATMAVAPLTGCKIIKLPYTIAKSVATDVGDAVGLVDKEKSAKDSPSTKTSRETPSDNKQQTEEGNSLGVFYIVWAVLLLGACMTLFIIKNKNRTNGHLRPLDPRDAGK